VKAEHIVPENFSLAEKQTDKQTNRQTCSSQHAAAAWPSAHGQIGSADPLEKWMKNQKAKTCKKEQFSMFMLYFESNQGMAGVENGAMLTTYLFR